MKRPMFWIACREAQRVSTLRRSIDLREQAEAYHSAFGPHAVEGPAEVTGG